MAGKYYSPTGNFEVWDEKPEGYYTEEEWAELHPPVPYVPTKAERLSQLDAQYEADKAELSKYYVEAVLSGNIDAQTDIKTELDALTSEYDKKRAEIEGE